MTKTRVCEASVASLKGCLARSLSPQAYAEGLNSPGSRSASGRTSVEVATLEEIFDVKNFFVEIEFESREECLNFVTDKEVEQGFMSKTAKESVFERERMSSKFSALLMPHFNFSYGNSINKCIQEYNDLGYLHAFLL